ncbi:MAG: S8 family serine peptidase, partial [Candidatus Omnitrophica bacterium]|nr:S8 family serine peptidase [Candidatus Omnitrophota bacterium]
IYLLKMSEGSNVETACKDYAKDPNVLYAEPNYIYRTSETIPNEYNSRGELANAQWALNKINCPDAWDIETGGPNIEIAIIDTGIDYNHVDLKDNIVSYVGYDFVDINTSYYEGYSGVELIEGEDYTEPDSDPMDFEGHGTFVAGICSAVTDNSTGIAGVSWHSKLVAVRAGFALIYDGQRTAMLESDDIANAISYAGSKGCDVINMSFGNPAESYLIRDAINNNKGSIFIAAAGNEPVEDPLYPAFNPNVIAVASTDRNDQLSSFSAYGDWIDICAPGESIKSTYPKNRYASGSGTSAAAPIVSGVAALIRSQHSFWDAEKIKAQLKDTADNIDSLNPSYKGKLGAGRINAYEALGSQDAASQIIIKDYGVFSTPSNVFGEVRPGERIELTVILKNIMSDLSDVRARLSTDSSYVTGIGHSTVDFGDLHTSQEKDNLDDPFIFNVHPSAPWGQDIEFTLTIGASGYSITQNLKIKIGNLPSIQAEIAGEVIEGGIMMRKPIEQAEVNLYDYMGGLIDTTYTDSGGKYKFSNLGRNWYKIEVKKQGYSSVTKKILASESIEYKVDFQLILNAAFIKGIVTGIQFISHSLEVTPGPPIKDVMISLINGEGQILDSVFSDADGHYSITTESGTGFTLKAEKDGYETIQTGPFNLSPLEQRDIEDLVLIPMRPWITIEVETITGPQGNMAADTKVTLYDEEENLIDDNPVFTEEGKYRFALSEEGKYKIKVEKQGYQSVLEDVQVSKENMYDVNIQLVP